MDVGRHPVRAIRRAYREAHPRAACVAVAQTPYGSCSVLVLYRDGADVHAGDAALADELSAVVLSFWAMHASEYHRVVADPVMREQRRRLRRFRRYVARHFEHAG